MDMVHGALLAYPTKLVTDVHGHIFMLSFHVQKERIAKPINFPLIFINASDSIFSIVQSCNL